jgi:hypothetical protein
MSDPEWTKSYVEQRYEEETLTAAKAEYKMRHALSVAFYGASYDPEYGKYQHVYGLSSSLVARFNDLNNPHEGYVRGGTNNSLMNHSLEVDVTDPGLTLFTSTDENHLGLHPAEGTDSKVENVAEVLIEDAVNKVKEVTIGNLETAAEIFSALTYSESADTVDRRNQKTIAANYDPAHTFDSHIYLTLHMYSNDSCVAHPFTVCVNGENRRFTDGNTHPSGTSLEKTFHTEPQTRDEIC